MRQFRRPLTLAVLTLVGSTASAQTFRSADTVIKRMWRVGMEQSQTERLAQVLIDSIGPRLSGSPGFTSAVEWLERTYKGWGVPVRREQYGTWRGWRIGPVHMDLIAPRTQTLEVELLAWSPGTGGRPVEGDVVAIPELADSAAAAQWLRTLRGKFVLVSAPEIMCRAPQELERYARPTTVTRINARRSELQQQGFARFRSLAPANTPGQMLNRVVYGRLDSAGVAGVISLTWSGGWGVNKIFGSNTERSPSVDLSCED